MPVYFDTALLLKLYTPEPDTPAVVALVGSLSEPIFLTTFHLTEFANALHCKQGRGEITEDEAFKAAQNLMGDYGRKFFVGRIFDWDAALRRTVGISTAHAARTLCRTLDAMHVAIALELRATAIGTTDARQIALANAVGLKVLTP